jgi:hypothetical protein
MMNVKTKSLVAASVAAVLGTGAAHAVDPGTAPTYTFYIGGGSAEPQAVQVALCKLFGTTADVYTNNGGGTSPYASSNYLVFYGKNPGAVGTGAGAIAANSNVLVVYKYNGGSYTNGAVPQASPYTPLVYGATSDYNGTGNTAHLISTGPGAGNACTAGDGGQATYSYTDTGDSTGQTAVFGLTDIEVTGFAGDNNPNGATSALVTPDNASPAYDLIFGTAVTANLYAKKTSFTSTELAAIYSGQVTDWSQILGDNHAPLFATKGTAIVLLDRNVGSGTKASGTTQYLGYPELGSDSVAPGSVTFGYIPSSGSNTISPLNNTIYQDVQDTSATAVAQNLQKAQNAGVYAIGRLSADNPPYLYQCSSANCFDFVKYNGTGMDSGGAGDNINGPVGSATTYLNVMLGAYSDFYQVSFNYSKNVAANTQAASFLNAMKAELAGTDIPGCIQGAFPSGAPGTAADGSTNAYVAGVTQTSRKQNSDQAPVQVKIGVTYASCSDPL